MGYHSEQDLLYGRREAKRAELPGGITPTNYRLCWTRPNGMSYRYFPSHAAAYRASKRHGGRLEWWDGAVWVS